MEATLTRPSPSLDEWQGVVGALEQQIALWCENQGWAVTPSEKQVTDVRPRYGLYSIPMLSVETPHGRLIVEPMAHGMNGTGTVQVYAWPTLYRVRLLRRGNPETWVILTDSGVPLHEDWGEPTFVRLAQDLLKADY